MTTVTIDLNNLVDENATGFVRFTLANPTSDVVALAPITRPLVNGQTTFFIDSEFVGQAFWISFPKVYGLYNKRYLVSMPSGTVTLEALIEGHQINPTSLEPVENAELTIQEQIAEIRQIAESGGISDEQLGLLLEEYFAENPIIISNTEWGDDPRPDTVFENGLA